MKNLSLKISILAFLVLASVSGAVAANSPAPQGNLSGKINLQNASSVSSKANKEQLNHPEILNNVLYNATAGGMGNFMQGMSGNPSNAYSMQERTRQQVEYIKQSQ